MRAAGGYSRSQAPSGDLAILSAETYVEPGLSFLPSPPSTTSTGNSSRKKIASGSGNEGTSSSRKRLKRTSPEEGSVDREGDEEEKKRSRGRPRLDIKDETAADRRRTQIRLAQRAYRNRKENAIQTLERRVQELRDTNEEMSNAFMRLHDFAVNNGLVDQAPEFGRQLRATTEKFLTLARLSSEDNIPKVDDHAEGDSPRQQQISDVESSTKTSLPKPVVITPPPDTASMSSILEAKGNQVYGGFIVTHEPVIEDLLTPTEFTLRQTGTAAGGNSSMPGEYEIITQPTLDNASFPFPFDLSLSSINANTNANTNHLNLGFSSPGQAQTQSQFQNSPFNTFSGSLFPSLSAPTSYGAQEATFGRRLQRTGIERALVLITMPNPPLKTYNRIFGFCLMLESKEAIYKRLVRGIQKTANESLNYWAFPFYNLGGAGTQLTNGNGNTGQRIGNEGTVDVMKPTVTSASGNGGTGAGPSYNMGPFTSRVTEVSEKLLDRDMRVNPTTAGAFLTATADGSPGLANGLLGGGEYFDCDEVEIYLHQRGVVIPPAADFITAEINTVDFEAGNGNGNGNESTGKGLGGNENFGSGMSSLGMGMSPLGMGMETASTGTRSGSGTGISSPNTGTDHDIWGLGVVDPMLQTQWKWNRSTRKTVTVDINQLVYELTERTVCLGRTPGIKQEDINEAFWKASQVLA
ncbi:hypothetical protein V8F20_009571 [Naviculisporaceae sp. PSN 640]